MNNRNWGGKRAGSGRPKDSVKPWDRIAIAERFYVKLCEVTQRLGYRSIHATECELYVEDNPDDPHMKDQPRLDQYRDNLKKARERGRSESMALDEEPRLLRRGK